MNIFVGNLSFEAKESDVRNLFRSFGEVTSVAIVMEKNGRKSRGFGFVQMPDEEKAQEAISALDGKEFKGRPLNVSIAVSTLGPPGKMRKKKNGYKQGRRSRAFMRKKREESQ